LLNALLELNGVVSFRKTTLNLVWPSRPNTLTLPRSHSPCEKLGGTARASTLSSSTQLHGEIP
jgi:hypothetical protein